MYRTHIHPLNIPQLNLNIPIISLVLVLADDLQNIIINKIAVIAINDKKTIIRNIIQSIPELYLV
jgi:hypothetical protein